MQHKTRDLLVPPRTALIIAVRGITTSEHIRLEDGFRSHQRCQGPSSRAIRAIFHARPENSWKRSPERSVSSDHIAVPEVATRRLMNRSRVNFLSVAAEKNGLVGIKAIVPSDEPGGRCKCCREPSASPTHLRLLHRGVASRGQF